MMHHDAVHCPTVQQVVSLPGSGQRSVLNQAAHLAYLDVIPFMKYNDKDIEKVGGACLHTPTVCLSLQAVYCV